MTTTEISKPHIPVVIGFGYRARQGKDVCVSTIIAEHPELNIARIAFADALKEEVNQFDQFELCLRHGLEYDFKPFMEDPLCNTKHGKQARLLQFWGAYRRSTDPFYWIKKMRDKIDETRPTVVLIPDMRYKNEFYYVKAMGGFVVKVTRQGFVDLTRDPKHISEVDLDGMQFDYEIHVGEGEVEQLKKDALTVFNLIGDSLDPGKNTSDLRVAA